MKRSGIGGGKAAGYPEPQRGDTMNNPQWSAAELGVGKHHKSLKTPAG
jgi:hypothetical protein